MPLNDAHSSAARPRLRKRRKIRIGVRNGLRMSEKFSPALTSPFYYPPASHFIASERSFGPSFLPSFFLLRSARAVSNYYVFRKSDDPTAGAGYFSRGYLAKEIASIIRFVKFDDIY